MDKLSPKLLFLGLVVFLGVVQAVLVLFPLSDDDEVDRQKHKHIHEYIYSRHAPSHVDYLPDITPGVLQGSFKFNGTITGAKDLPHVFRHDPYKWSGKNKIKVCVFTRTPRQDSLFATNVMSMLGKNKFNYVVLPSTNCQHRGTCTSEEEARSHPDCDAEKNPMVRMVERLKRCQHERYDKVMSVALNFWDVVFSTGDEYCQTTHIASKAQFRTYYGPEVVKSRIHPELPTYIPLGPRGEFQRVAAHDVKLATDRHYLFNFVGSFTSVSRKKLYESLLSNPENMVPGSQTFVHVIEEWKKRITEENGYIMPDEYRQILLNSTFTLCPQGHNPEAFRIFEACEAGSIPILTLDIPYKKHPCKNSFGDLIKYGAPFVFLNNWAELGETLKTLMSDPQRLRQMQADVMGWYRGYMTMKMTLFEEQLEKRFLERIGRVSLSEVKPKRIGRSDGSW